MERSIKEERVLSPDELCSEIDRLLTEREIGFVVRDGLRGFSYDGVSVSVGVLEDESQTVVAVGAVVLFGVEVDGLGAREDLLADFARAKRDFSSVVLLQFTEPNKMVWAFRTIDADEFTPEGFLHELEEVTRIAIE